MKLRINKTFSSMLLSLGLLFLLSDCQPIETQLIPSPTEVETIIATALPTIYPTLPPTIITSSRPTPSSLVGTITMLTEFGKIKTLNLENGQIETVYDSAPQVGSMQVGTEGYIYFLSGGHSTTPQVYRLNPRDKELDQLTNDLNFKRTLNLSILNDRLAYYEDGRDSGGKRTQIRVLDLTNNILKLVYASNDFVDDFSWSPDGKSLLIVTDTNDGYALSILDLANNETHELAQNKTSYIQIEDPAWSSDGKIAFQMDSSIYIADLATGESNSLTESLRNCCAQWSDNPNFLLYQSVDDRSKKAYLNLVDISKQTKSLIAESDPQSDILHPNIFVCTWAPGGTEFACGIWQDNNSGKIVIGDIYGMLIKEFKIDDKPISIAWMNIQK